MSASMSRDSKLEIIKIKWAETVELCKNLSDEELIQRISELEQIHIEAQAALEAARHIGNSRADDMRSKFSELQREQDRKYSPRPADKVAFDKKAREEKVKVSKDDKAIAMMMSLGLSADEARKRLSDAKAGKA